MAAAGMEKYTYVFAIGTFFAMLDAYNNGASESWWPKSTQPSIELISKPLPIDDVANSWVSR